jgi:hypothetical protein
MKRFRTLIIVSLIVTVAAVLIMPQVEMPDAVVNSARVQVTSLAHFGAGSLLTAKILPNLSSQTLSSHGSRFLREVTEHRYADAHSVLTQIHTLRC